MAGSLTFTIKVILSGSLRRRLAVWRASRPPHVKAIAVHDGHRDGDPQPCGQPN